MMRVFSLVPSKYMSSLFVPQKNAAIQYDSIWHSIGITMKFSLPELHIQRHICYVPRFLLARAKLNIYEKQMNLNSKVFDSWNN